MSNKNEVKVVELPLSELEVTHYNPRFIRDESFRKLQQSILRDPDFMRLRPLLINETSKGKFIYAGAQRYRACLDMGWEKIPCIVDKDLSEEVIKDRMVKDNLHHGQWDEDKFTDFDTNMLDFLDLKEMNKSVSFDMTSMEKAGEKTIVLKDNYNDKSESEESVIHGTHVFNILFADDEEKKLCDILLTNIAQEGQRPEDRIAQILKLRYGKTA
jgi:hypothetical protein